MKKNYEIKDIAGYFVDLKMVNGKYAIRVNVPDTWKVPKYEGVLVGRQKGAQSSNGRTMYIICNDEDHDYGQNELIGVMVKIERFNHEMEEKRVLLKEKTEELIKIFQENDIDELRKLKFNVGKKRGRPVRKEESSAEASAETEEKEVGKDD